MVGPKTRARLRGAELIKTSPERPPPERPLVDLHGRSAWSILPALLAGFFMIMIDTTVVNIAVPTLVKHFGASLVQVGWVNSAYLLTFAVLLLVTGRLGDTFGPRPVFAAGLVVFTAASLACGLSPSIGWLIAARAVQGVGGAMMTPQTMAMITRVFPPKQRGAALGMWGSVAGVATITGPLLGGLLVETVGWEWIFFVNLPVGAVALWLTFTRLPTLERHTRSVDHLGMVLSVAGMFLLVFGLQEGEAYAWGQVRWGITVWQMIAAGVGLLVVFGWWQLRRGEDALVPMRLFTNQNFFLANVSSGAIGFTMTGIFLPLTLFLQVVAGMSPMRAALVALPGSLVSGFVAPMAGRLSDRVPAKWVVAFGFAMLAVSVAWMAVWIGDDGSPWRLLAPNAVLGLGTGSVFSPLANLATSGLDHRTAGAGAGTFNTNRQVGGVIGSAAIIAMITGRLSHTLPAAAREEAGSVPAAYRDQFAALFDAGGGAQGGRPDFTAVVHGSVAGADADTAAALASAAASAFDHGFAAAAGQTMVMVAAVAAVGLVSALVMRGGATHT
ncbi:MAG: DHA2 family efflux MFS transporter permease subunit [Micrococcales bacterium]|nr:DHA2 family efflux MFS transporter permease subunit [Micrococcales bacterium]MCL2668020.1 DHA2 family efflux MFS transporter permease subunit [Micrococcales bacterium]